MPAELVPFDKPALTSRQLLELLKQRGLAITDETRAVETIDAVGFYRLSAYMLPFQVGDGSAAHHRFRQGVTFEQVLAVYDFDAELRDLTFRALSELEVRVAAIMTDALSLAHGSHWFMNESLYKTVEHHSERLEELGKAVGPGSKKTVAVEHYHARYSEPSLPPSWATLAAIEFGALSRLFEALKRAVRKPVAQSFGFDGSIVASWLQAASQTRNLCAHHQRLWNRTFALKPASPAAYPEDISPTNNSTFYAQACVIALLNRGGRKPRQFADDLANLFERYRFPLASSLGFPPEWRRRPVWTAQ